MSLKAQSLRHVARGPDRRHPVKRSAVDREIERRWPELETSGYRPSVARSAYEAGSHADKHVDLGDGLLGRSSSALPDAAAG